MSQTRPRTKAAADAERRSAAASRRWPLIAALVGVGLVAVLGAAIAYRGSNLPLAFDTEWMNEILDSRHPALEVPAQIMDAVGGHLIGIVLVPVAIIVVLCFLRRFWAALYFTVATVLSAGLVQLLKGIFDRPRPEDILVVADIGSFPSGHVANAATMAVVIGFIAERTWVWAAGVAYTLLMMLSRTFLGAHWVSDTVGGLVLGAAVAVIVWAPFAHRMHREHESRRAIAASERVRRNSAAREHAT
ncbi:phosphatase PAP2 family protein [Marisediminicola sp. LYQ134]|uniref:phosphatase PAP2 family protein n=1 Tax=Marisediminicola sp. LYQ134 TaxID=3391061 RepID=UPI003982FF26